VIGRFFKGVGNRLRLLWDWVGELMARWLDGVRKLKGLSADERSVLSSSPTYTRTKLAARVAEEGLEATADKRMDPGRLRDTLARYALAEVNGKTRLLPIRLLRAALRNWREAVYLLALVLLVAGVRRAMGHPERVVVAARDLVPYQVIEDTVVVQPRREADFDTYTSLDDVIGRFPLQAINKGDPVPRNRLSRVQFENPAILRGRRALALSVPAASAALAAPGSRVMLLFTPAESGGQAGHEVADALVLDARTVGDASSVVVAVTASDLDALKPLLGRSLVTIAQQPVPSSP
jgi:hypothetical protein